MQVMSWRAERGFLAAVVVAASEDDAVCCPGDKVAVRWPVSAGGVLGSPVENVVARVSLADLDGEWRLVSWFDETAPAGLTLVFEGAAVRGQGGCNGFFGRAMQASAGALAFGPLGATRMACGEDIDAAEAQYLAALGAVAAVSFLPEQLLLGTPRGELVFERVPPDQASVR